MRNKDLFKIKRRKLTICKMDASGNLLYDAGSSNRVLCDNLEGWDGVAKSWTRLSNQTMTSDESPSAQDRGFSCDPSTTYMQSRDAEHFLC